jgi:15-cis-phytoene synthase
MQDASSQCEALLRAGDRDRFLAALFAPAEHRSAILALYAFNLEIARVREVAREPLAGEIRLQWWSDVLGGEPRGEAQGHPVVAALLAAVAKYRLDKSRLLALIEARSFDLFDEPMLTMADFEKYADAAAGGLMSLCAQVLDNGGAPGTGELSHHAGIAHAIAGLLSALALHARRGQLYLPLELLRRHGSDRQEQQREHASPALRAALAEFRLIARRHLERARELRKTAPAHLLPAYLPAALAGPTLARMERPDYEPFVPVEIAPWRRQWLIWRAARHPDRIFR